MVTKKRIPFPGLPGTITDQGMFRKVGTPGGSDTQGGENAFNARFKLKFIASDTLGFLFSADYTRARQEARPSTLLFTKAGPNDGTVASAYNGCIFGQAPTFICSNRGVVGTSFSGVNVDADPNNNRLPISDAFVTSDIDKSYARGSNFDNLTSWGLSLTTNLELSDGASLKLITAYRSLDSKFGSEIAATPIILNDASFAMDQKQFSQEFQLNHDSLDGRLKGTLGLYYFSETGGLLDTPVFAEGLIQIYGPNRFSNKAYAAFAHEHFDLTDKLGLTFGVRYTKENKKFRGDQQDLNAFWARAGAGVDPNVVTSLPLPFLPDQNDLTRLYPFGLNKLSFSNVSIKAGAEYKFSPAVMAYYSFAQGFKSGGWTTRLLSPSTLTANDLTFRPEKANTHEIGLKSKLLDGHLRLNLAAFSTAYKDIQITEIIAISPAFKNAGEATIRGFEAESEARFGGFGLTAGIGYLDAHYTKMSPGATIPVTNDLVNAPEWSVSLGANYRHELANGSAFTLNGDYNYKSSTSPDAENSPYLRSGNVGLLNGSLAFDDADDRWGVTFGVKNITDKRFVVGGYDQSGPNAIGYVGVGYSPPRQWYLTLRVKN
ncbi:TonB-dependent receptor (plasmid) [Novosphingobium sp. PP1Y]|nr:TonB-dependent receptor [Novosphingobium sp. PP1Y]